MSAGAASDDPAAFYRAVCAGERSTPDDPSLQDHWALPHHQRPGAPPNADGVRNALSREPQTDGVDHEAAASHLNGHMDEIHAAEGNRAKDEDLSTFELGPGELELRSLDRREVGALVAPYGDIVETPIGLEMFKHGAFANVNPARVTLRGPEHDGPVVGRGIALEDRAEGAYMTFKVAKTLHGDELLELAREKVTPFVSVAYWPQGSHGDLQTRGGKRFTAWERVDLRHVATTSTPYYERAAILDMRSKQGDAAMAAEETPAAVAAPDTSAFEASLAKFSDRFEDTLKTVTGQIADLQERARSNFEIPGAPAPEKTDDAVSGGMWLQYALRALSGDRISTQDLQYRALADIVTSDNLGVVPDTFMQSELIGVIDPSRPFMATTRRLPTPTSGMTLHVPRITQRPIVGLQSEEKAEIASQETHIDTADFSAVTKAGGGDIGLQILKLSDPSFLDLYLRLLAEAYAQETEKEALEALLADGNVNDGNSFDPTSTTLGQAFTTAFSAMRRGPDTIWLSTEAVGAMIDAVNPSTGLPLYSSITADFSVPGGITGTIKGLRPVHVPELGALGADIIVGPSSGFAWAEAGTYTLQVDVPARAGRDVAIVGILWFAPYYPSAFTVYTLASA